MTLWTRHRERVDELRLTPSSCGQLHRLGPSLPGVARSLCDPVDPGRTAAPALTCDDPGSSTIHSPYHHCLRVKHNMTVESEPRREVPM